VRNSGRDSGDDVSSLVLRGARLVGDGRVVDVELAGERIAAIRPAVPHGPRAGNRNSTGRDTTSREINLDGRWLMPGLWDAHVHFTQWARQAGRISVSAATSAAHAVSLLRSSDPGGDHGSVHAPGTWLVGRGFQDALWPDAPTAHALDAAFPGRAVVVVSHDLHSVWLNSQAATRLGASSPGLIREDAAFAAQIALDALVSSGDDTRLLAHAARGASARGVVGIRDLEMADNVASWAARVDRGLTSLRVEACIYPAHLAASDARGLPSGAAVPGSRGLVTVGGLKIFADGALNTRTALTHKPYGGRAGSATEPSVGHAAHTEDELRELLRAAKERGLEVALHAIGDLAVSRALDAFSATDARGSIEHAQLVRTEDLPRFAALGVAASIQPQHALDDRDVTDAVWGDRATRAFAYRSLQDAGARLLLGSDAPVAPLDPWISIAAAVTRTDDEREPWHPEQALTREAALAASVRTRVALGEPADLVAVEADPLVADAATLREMSVALTVVAGQVTYE